MKKKSENLLIVQDDIRRYKNNKLGQWLCYGGLAFSCLYIMLLYSFCDSMWYVMLMGVSVLLTLVLLLISFLCAEGVKAYNKKYCYVLIVLAVVEIVRIFIFPLMGWQNQAFHYTVGGSSVAPRDYFSINLSQSASLTLLIVYLVASAAFYAAAAIYSYIICLRHEKFEKQMEEGKVDVEAALVGLEQEDLEAAAAVAAADATVAETSEEVK